MHRRFLLVMAFTIFQLFVLGQMNMPESRSQAWEMLNGNLQDSNRQQVYNYLAELYFNNSQSNNRFLDSAFYYARKGVYLIDSLNKSNFKTTNESLFLLGLAYIQDGHIATGKKICMQVIRNYQKNQQKLEEAKMWYRMAKHICDYTFADPLIPNYYDSAANLYRQINLKRKELQTRIDKLMAMPVKNNAVLFHADLQRILTEARKDDYKNYSFVYAVLSIKERYRGNLNKGLEYALEALKYIDRSDYPTIAEHCYGELAQVYEELDEPANSVYWYRKCIEERKKNKCPQFLIYRTTSLMIVQMIKLAQEKEALHLLKQLAKNDPPQGPIVQSLLAQTLAYCYVAMHQYKLAEAKFVEMINGYKEGTLISELHYIAYCDIGKFYVETGQYSNARTYLYKALDIAGSTPGRKKELELFLFKADSATGHMNAAIKHFQAYKHLNDSIFNETKSRQIEELMIKYEAEKKDQNIRLLEKENKLQHGQINQTRNWTIGVAGLLLLITGLLVNYLRLKHRTNEQLQVQQGEIVKKNDSLQRLLKEKDWLVKEIHHRVKNNFHIVMGLLGTQSAYLESKEAIQAIHESQHRVQAMSLVHQKLYQSDNLSAISMVDYIYELVDYLKDSFDVHRDIQFTLHIEPIELSVSHCIPLGLVLNEAITNAIKYAFPDRRHGMITVSFKRAGKNQLRLTVIDNGVGLPKGFDMHHPTSMGMKLMAGLSEDIDAKFTISTTSETIVELVFTYDHNTNDYYNAPIAASNNSI
jgi:two-component system, sensor histidine kinase PdtaS